MEVKRKSEKEPRLVRPVNTNTQPTHGSFCDGIGMVMYGRGEGFGGVFEVCVSSQYGHRSTTSALVLSADCRI